MSRSSQFLAAITRRICAFHKILRPFGARPRRAFFTRRAFRSNPTSAENPEARWFAGDEISSIARPLHSLRCLLTTLRFHPGRLFRHGRRAGGNFTEAIKSRAEDAPTVPRFPENDSIVRL
jgi:hypothetical protein